MIRLLIAVHLFGTAYGFWWYREQLRVTPAGYWPIVPDSPGATLLFGLFLIALAAGRRLPWLESLAILSSLKYGLWTPLVMGHFWLTTGQATFESMHLSLSHLGMALEAVLFARVYRPLWPYPLWAGAWLLFNDYMDYIHGFHPTLPIPEAVGLIGGFAVSLSLVSFFFILFFIVREREKGVFLK